METHIGTSCAEAAEYLKQDHLVAIPTETVYGLAGNALSEAAILRIFKAKNRPHFNPLIVHFGHWDALEKYVKLIPEPAKMLAAAFSPGPLTLLLERNHLIPDLVTAGHPKVAIRIPAHALTRQLLEIIDFPLAAPSANPFGYVSPTTASHVYEGLAGKIPYILDGGPCMVGVESTIIDFEKDEVIIRRIGGVSREAIERVLGKPVFTRNLPAEHPVAPGQLKSHYATHTPLHTGNIEALSKKFYGKKIALIEFGSASNIDASYRFNLSLTAGLEEAASKLFAVMRQADAVGADVILAAELPNEGIGRAINDRISRAAHVMKS